MQPCNKTDNAHLLVYVRMRVVNTRACEYQEPYEDYERGREIPVLLQRLEILLREPESQGDSLPSLSPCQHCSTVQYSTAQHSTVQYKYGYYKGMKRVTVLCGSM